MNVFSWLAVQLLQILTVLACKPTGIDLKQKRREKCTKPH
jgi:hypothetical protein